MLVSRQNTLLGRSVYNLYTGIRITTWHQSGSGYVSGSHDEPAGNFVGLSCRTNAFTNDREREFLSSRNRFSIISTRPGLSFLIHLLLLLPLLLNPLRHFKPSIALILARECFFYLKPLEALVPLIIFAP